MCKKVSRQQLPSVSRPLFDRCALQHCPNIVSGSIFPFFAAFSTFFGGRLYNEEKFPSKSSSPSLNCIRYSMKCEKLNGWNVWNICWCQHEFRLEFRQFCVILTIFRLKGEVSLKKTKKVKWEFPFRWKELSNVYQFATFLCHHKQ